MAPKLAKLEGPAINCWPALMPMTTENGCLRIAPGSHHVGTVVSTSSEDCPGHRRVAKSPNQWLDGHMNAGDVCIFHRLTVHGSGPNTTTQPRIGYAVHYHRHDTTAFIANG